MAADFKREEAYVVYSELPRGEAAIISSVCGEATAGDPSMNWHAMRSILDVQASIESARKRRAWLGKAGLGHGVILGEISKDDDVSYCGGLEEGRLSARRSS